MINPMTKRSRVAMIGRDAHEAQELIRPLVSSYLRPEQSVAVFGAYSDETENPRGQFLVGGYIACQDEWPWVARAWQERVLDGPPRIPYLHMREIRRPAWRIKHHVSVNDAEERVSEAARIMDSFGDVAATSSMIHRKDLSDIYHSRYRRKKNVPLGLDEPDYLCFLAYAYNVIHLAHVKWKEAERVDFVVSRKKSISDHVREFKEDLAELLQPPFKELVGDLLVVSMEDRLPLQAADVLLWHLQHYYACGQNQFKMRLPDRMRLAQLTHEGNMSGVIHEWKREELERIANKWFAMGRVPNKIT